MALIDKGLIGSTGYQLTNTGDFTTTEDEYSILSAAQNRILAEASSWIFDMEYGSLITELSNTPVQLITERQIRGYIELALAPMLEDNRIIKIISIKITERDSTSIQVEIQLELDRTNGILDINIPL